MNGNLMVWQKTNQTSVTRPTQMPATSAHSKILPRTLQVRIAQRRATLIKIDVHLDPIGETAFAQIACKLQCASRGLDRFLKLSGFGVCCGQCSNKDRVIL